MQDPLIIALNGALRDCTHRGATRLAIGHFHEMLAHGATTEQAARAAVDILFPYLPGQRKQMLPRSPQQPTTTNHNPHTPHTTMIKLQLVREKETKNCIVFTEIPSDTPTLKCPLYIPKSVPGIETAAGLNVSIEIVAEAAPATPAPAPAKPEKKSKAKVSTEPAAVTA